MPNVGGEAGAATHAKAHVSRQVNRGLATPIHRMTNLENRAKTAKPKHYSTESGMKAVRKGVPKTQGGFKFHKMPNEKQVAGTHKGFVAGSKAHFEAVNRKKALRVKKAKKKA